MDIIIGKGANCHEKEANISSQSQKEKNVRFDRNKTKMYPIGYILVIEGRGIDLL